VLPRRHVVLELIMAFLLLTCEHGGNRIPRRWTKHFRGLGGRLATHEGFDIGAAAVAKRLARSLDAPLLLATTSRLLVDLNRSIGNETLFSNVTSGLPQSERRAILEEYYLPHRAAVDHAVALSVQKRITVIHVGVHSFTPVLRGDRRKADIGLLYDPKRPAERGFAGRWHAALVAEDGAIRVRRNYPYRGAGDGLTTALRRRYEPTAYVGLELEINQGLLGTPGGIAEMARLVGASLKAVLQPNAGHSHQSGI
jgi:predicted N-formylglutamate amidohydrolase